MPSFTETRKKLQKRLVLLDEIEQMVRDDPAFADELRSALGVVEVPRATAKGRPRVTTDSPNVERITNALAGRDWTGTQALREAAGLSKSQFFVAARAGEDRLESRVDPANRRGFQWRLKTSS